MKQLMRFLQNQYVLLCLLLYVVLLRVPLILDGMTVFAFDHGKDAIATFHMWQTMSPKLIGPWTSIPGLFFGPAWYYLLLPGMVLSGGNPIASVVMMLVLGLIAIYVLYKTFGLIEAVLFATSAICYTITTSAWNPFPMVLVTFVILGLLKHIEVVKKVTPKVAFYLGISAALGFHFSTAFAIFYPILIALSIMTKNIKRSWKDVLFWIGGFIIPFIPQIIFEIRHNFIEIRGILAYLQAGDGDPASLGKLLTVLTVTWGEVSEVFLPSAYFKNNTVNTLFFGVFLLLFSISFYYFLKQIISTKKQYLLKDFFFWFTLPLLGFTFLHFNVWYVLPLVAFTFIMAGQVLRAAPRWVSTVFLCFCLVVSLSRVTFYLYDDKYQLIKSAGFLPNKQAAIEYIYQQAQGKPFASYQFMPDIYDYPYQYLYFLQAKKGERLPTEFSYSPGEISYIPEKAELLSVFDTQKDSRDAELIFYIIEKVEDNPWYDQWWSAQHHGKILNQYQVAERLTVITAEPEQDIPNDK